MRRITYILLTLLLVACKPTELVTKETIREVRIVEHDTTIVTDADSASLTAYLHCDSAYNVVLDDLQFAEGERILLQAQLNKRTNNGTVLQLSCHEDSLLQVIAWQDSIISTSTTEMKVVKERYVPQYYKSVSVGFWILLVLIVLYIVLKVLWKVYGSKLTTLTKLLG